MVNVLAHDLKLCLAQWPASEKRYEPGVLREQLAQLFERYPGLRISYESRAAKIDAIKPEHPKVAAYTGRLSWSQGAMVEKEAVDIATGEVSRSGPTAAYSALLTTLER